MKSLRFPLTAAALLAALLLSLAIFSFSHSASAEEAPRGDSPSVRGGFLAEPLPADGDVSGTSVMGVPRLSEKARENAETSGPRNKRLRLSIPRLGMKDVSMGNSSEQSYLDREGIMHLRGTDFPWESNSNTYIAGHAIGYPGGRVPEAFRNLSDLRRGDKIVLRDSRGEAYRYRVYKRLVVDPFDVWVTNPVRGKDIVSLQTCYPEPTFEKRLIVRAERVE